MFKGLFSAWPSEEDQQGDNNNNSNSNNSSSSGPPTTATSSTTGAPRRQTSATSASSSHHQQRPPSSTSGSRRLPQVMPSHLLQDDPSLMDIESEDELADKLLVQFPAYGSQHQKPLSSINPTADWLLGGTSQIPKSGSLNKAKHSEGDSNNATSSNNGSSYGEEKQANNNEGDVIDNADNINNRPAVVFNKDWDEEEQQLWRSAAQQRGGVQLRNTPRNRQPNPSTKEEDDEDDYDPNGYYLSSTLSAKQQFIPLDPANNWLHAYYYHIGVLPRLPKQRKGPVLLPHRTTSTFQTTTSAQATKKKAFNHNYHPEFLSLQWKEQQEEMFSPQIKLDALQEEEEGQYEEEKDSTELLIVPGSGTKAIHQRSGSAASDAKSLSKVLHQRSASAASIQSDSASSAPPDEEQKLESNNTTETMTTNLVNAMNDDRQHWMPDQLCKHCYACDQTFTVFRRRHHCRVCGQIFCNTCSGYFVPAGPQVKQVVPVLNLTVTVPVQVAGQTATSNATMLRTCRMCYDQITSRQEREKKEEENQLLEAKQKQQHLGAGGHADTETSPTTTTVPPGQAPTLPDKLGHNSVLQKLSKKQEEDDNLLAKHGLDTEQQAIIETQEREHSSLLSPFQKPEPIPSPGRNRLLGQTIISGEDLQSRAGRAERVKAANRHLGLCAASHLETLGKSLLESDAPILWKSLTYESQKQWINKLMELATKCCSTVEPNVRKGDLLDLRPYCKVKVIPGGTLEDSAYMSGVVFRKVISHKSMAKEINNPRIMLLSGGIEFTRTENRIASLDTLLEQEEKYIEILVGKILKVKPDILLVGKSVSRKAQELLLENNVVLMQHVKSNLLNRISRQTGATVISSTDHIMNQFGAHVLGKCNRFRFMVARDNEAWIDEENKGDTIVGSSRRNVKTLLCNPDLSNSERQAALAASQLGEGLVDGAEAVRSGLAKRGVAHTYMMLEGCPKHLGCTVVLRGANRTALKQAKIVFRFLVNVAYNLRLETSYLKERCARLSGGFKVEPKHLFSSSLCVDYGQAPSGKKIRPWNGGSNNEGAQRSISGEVTAFDHQSILITSLWMTDKSQCCPAEVKGICYYSLQDVSLGQFLRDSCFNLSLKCQNPSCKKSVVDHSLSFIHNDGLINITVDHMNDPLPPAPSKNSRSYDEPEENEELPIATWTYCKNCAKVVTPLVYISEHTWKYSFGKFLESFFYNRDILTNSTDHDCKCNLQTAGTLFFGCGRLAARFQYERVRSFGVFVRRSLPIDIGFHRTESLHQLSKISMESSQLFASFDKHIKKVTRDARAIFSNAPKRPEQLQTVLSELNRIGSEVDHAAKTLQEKIASVSDKCSKENSDAVNEALFRFPWFSRRYLYMLTSAWNEKLSAVGQVIVAMRKIASSSLYRGDIVMASNIPNIAGDQSADELNEGMRRLRQLHEVYSRYNLTDISTVLPIIPGSSTAAAEVDFDDDFEEADDAAEFPEGVDADVLASRRRLNNSATRPPSSIEAPDEKIEQRPTKSLGTRRTDDSPHSNYSQHRSQPETIPNSSVTSKVTAGGAVKSALNRFFNRGARESDPFVLDLGMFQEGRPRLEPGVDGIVVPVFDEQFCTMIAYSLSSAEYAAQFKNYSKMEEPSPDNSSELGAPHDSNGMKSTLGSTSKPHGSPIQSFKQDVERRMLVRNKSHIKHTFRDFDEKGQNVCKFICHTYWSTQFHAVRQVFLSTSGLKDPQEGAQPDFDVEKSFVQSLSSAYNWAASGGKSGASFSRTFDDRFVIKVISKTELDMFLDCAPAYFEYLSKAFFHGLPTVLCKILGVYQIQYHNRVTGKRTVERVAVMQNIFYNRKISKIFDLKGSLRGRFAAQVHGGVTVDDSHSHSNHTTDKTPSNLSSSEDVLSPDQPRSSKADGSGSQVEFPRKTASESNLSRLVGVGGEEGGAVGSSGRKGQTTGTLLDGDFLDFTAGRPMPMTDRAKALFHMSILNDTLFLSIINVLDYSILVGIDEETQELVVGIIDFMRQYDILKQMERVGKSLPMVVGSEAPTIIQPPLYKARFTSAMERYFMTVPSKWTTI